MAKDEVTGLQETMVDVLKRKYKNINFPDWLDSRDTEEGSAIVFIDKRTGNEQHVGLCDAHGFLDGILFTVGEVR